MSRLCRSVEEVVQEAMAAIRRENEEHPEEGAEIFFRGEMEDAYERRYTSTPTSFDPGTDREDKKFWLKERELYQEALRLNVVSFLEDRTMTDRLARMQHFLMPTRFADLSENVLQSLLFACGGCCVFHERTDPYDAIIRLVKVAKHKMKSFTSDIIVAISHLPLVDPERIQPGEKDGLDTLRYEIMKERTAFGFEKDRPTEAARLHREIQQVWGFKPILNSERIRSQKGLFLAFGCRKNKAPLHPTFSPDDYNNTEAPSYGIKQFAEIRIDARFKHKILEELHWFGLKEESTYPELADVSNVLRERFAKK